MKMNSGEWLLQKGGYDDCGITSVGGAAFALSQDSALSMKRDWKRFPVKEMIKRRWATSEEALGAEFFDRIRGWDGLCPLYRRTRIRSEKQVDPYALAAWTARVAFRSQEETLSGRYRAGSIDLAIMTNIARLSGSPTGPREAKARLSELGISLIVEPRLPQTHLDGAALLLGSDKAAIGLTIRHDRIDNFWFCLMHELAHFALHIDEQEETFFFDDLDTVEGLDPREKEADELAREALIPTAQWDESAAKVLPSKEAAELLAKELRIHPAIVAGRMRCERSYVFVSDLVGQGKVRSLFPNIEWS